MTNRYVISKYVSFYLWRLNVIVSTLASLLYELLSITISPLTNLVKKAINHCKERYYKQKTYHYVASDGGWMKRSTSEWEWWFVRSHKIYCAEERVEAIAHHIANDTMKERFAGCSLNVRIYHSARTRKICEVAFRIEKDGEAKHKFRLSDKEMSRIEYEIRNLPIETEYVSFDTCDGRVINIKF